MSEEVEKDKVVDEKSDTPDTFDNSTWIPNSAKAKPSRKKDEEDYAKRFLITRKIKDYTPVYIDVRMKEKLQTLVASLQHIAPEITPTILLSNILADHLSTNRELITRAANEGLKRSLASTFNEKDSKD